MKLRLVVNGNGVYHVEKKVGLFSGWNHLMSFRSKKDALLLIKEYEENYQKDKQNEINRKNIKVIKVYTIK
jgi:hypothetical protein